MIINPIKKMIADLSKNPYYLKSATYTIQNQLVGIAISAITACRAGFDAFQTKKLQTQKPQPQTAVLWTHPHKEKLEQSIEKVVESTGGANGTVLYHGTPHAKNMIAQAENCPQGSGQLEKRVCSNGDCAAGIYGISSLAGAYNYSGAQFIVKIASLSPCHFDQARGTPYIEATADKYLIAVYSVTNHEQIQSHTEATQADCIRIGLTEASKVFKKMLQSFPQ
jgi:hypothetical protein